MSAPSQKRGDRDTAQRDELKNVSTEGLIHRAEVRLGLARLGPIRGVRVRERTTAIAVLVGMPDRTEP